MKQYTRRYLACGLIGLLSSLANACALTSKAELVNVRYFSPERTANHPARNDMPRMTHPISLRLGRVQSRQHLRERIVYHDNDFELGYHEDLRWSERPEVYAERAISRALFERRANKRVLGASAPTLEVEVSAFQEVRASDGHYAFVQLEARVSEVNEVIWQSTINAREPIAGSRIEAVVAAMAAGLETAAESLAQGVCGALSARSTTSDVAIAP